MPAREIASQGNVNANNASKTSRYRPEIDGLRAFAVVAVIINHFNKEILPGGYLGVDIFFVISGYVITSSLFGRPSKDFKDFISGFYERRIKRLVPALSVFVLITSIAICLFDPSPGTSLRTGLTSLFGLSNLYLLKNSTNYFAQSTELNVFTHTWSLGVEEQFYILFPFLIWFSGFGQQTKNGARNLFLIVGALTIASLIGFLYLYPTNQPAAYFLMPSRFWEMAAGCLIFIVFQKRASTEQLLEKVPPLLVMALIVGVMYLPMSLAAASTISVVALSSILIASLKKQTAAFKVFTHPRVVYIGLISYSLYLWHWGVLSISRWTIGIHWWSVPFQIALMLGLAVASYRWIETPLRKGNWFGKRWKTLAVGGGVLVLVSGSLVAISKPLNGKLYTGRNNIERKTIFESTQFRENCNITPHQLSGKNYRPKPLVDEAFIQGCLSGDTHAKKILLIGDSFASVQLPMVANLSQELNLGFGAIFGYGCPYPIPFEYLKNGKSKKCKNIDETFFLQSVVSNINPGDLIIVRLYLPKSQYIDTDKNLRELLVSYDDGINKINDQIVKRGGKLLIIGANPTLSTSELISLNPQWFNISKQDETFTFSRQNTKETQIYLAIDERLDSIADSADWHYFPTRPYLCNQSFCFSKISGEPLYFDDQHLTQTAMMRYQHDLKNVIKSIIK